MVEGSPPLFSIVIRTIGRRYSILKQVLQHIDRTDLGLSSSDFEVVVSEDGPPYTLSEDLLNQDLSHIRVRYTPNTRSRGREGNRNAGALAARGKYLVLIDDDALLPPNFLRALANAFEKAGESAIFSIPFGVSVDLLASPINTTPKWIRYLFSSWAPDKPPSLDEISLPPVASSIPYEEHWFAHGRLTCISKMTYLELGGYTEIKFEGHSLPGCYVDDPEFSLRARSAGYKIYALRGVRIAHIEDHYIDTDRATARLYIEAHSQMMLRRLHPDKVHVHNAVDVFWHPQPLIRLWRLTRGELFSALLPALTFLAKIKSISPYLTKKLAAMIWIGVTYKGLKDGRRASYQCALIHEPPLR